MQTQYHKLIRDRIPEIIRQGGYHCAIETMSEEEYQLALREKLIEEALEAASAKEQYLLTELADLYEVMDALMNQHGIDATEVRAEQQRRRNERGSFERRIRLLSITTQTDE